MYKQTLEGGDDKRGRACMTRHLKEEGDTIGGTSRYTLTLAGGDD